MHFLHEVSQKLHWYHPILVTALFVKISANDRRLQWNYGTSQACRFSIIQMVCLWPDDGRLPQIYSQG